MMVPTPDNELQEKGEELSSLYSANSLTLGYTLKAITDKGSLYPLILLQAQRTPSTPGVGPGR